MNELALRHEARQHQVLTPRLQRAVRLLQLSSMDYAQELHATLERNPFLEAEEHEERDEAEGPLADTLGKADAHEGEAQDWASHIWPAASVTRQPGSGGGDGQAMEWVAADVSLRQHLHSQLNVLPLPDRDRVLCGVIVESLDDDGYLRLPLTDLLDLAGLDPRPGADEMLVALRQVQSLDPAGVGARDVAECVLLQLQAIEDPQDRELARRVVSHHISRLAQHDIPGLARELGRTPAELEAVCERIRHLDPRPGWRFGSSHIPYITPDVIVQKAGGAWTVVLNPAIVPRVRLNQVYADLFQQHREASHAELAAHLQEARWTMRNVEQRFSTILGVAQAIVKRQWKFFEYGPLAMKPLGLREIAEEVGVHESTVSRVTNNKYMVTPSGTIELKRFFSRAMPTASGGACTGTAIRGVIQDLLADEDPTEPLSDAELARRLTAQGLKVARRTVTKYRQMLRVPPVERRRRHA